MGSAYLAADVLAALLVEPPRCGTCGGGCELVVGAHSGFGAWVGHTCVCSVHEAPGRAVGLEAVWEAESRTWRPTDQGLLADPGASPRSSGDGRWRFPRRRTRVVAAGAVGAVGDAWGLYARVFYRYLARRMPGAEPLEMSTAIGMVAGRDWWGLIDAWELSVLNPGVSLDEARDYLESVAGAGARCAVDAVALAGVRQARVPLERERLLLAASSGTDAAGLESGELASRGNYLMTTGSSGDYGLGVWVWRVPTRQDRYEPGWHLDVTPLGEVDIDSCPDPDARALVEGWRLGAGDPVAAIVLAQAREALHARTDVSAPYLRTRLRYHLARIAAMDLPPERRGDALARLLRTQIDVLTSWPVDPSGIPEAAEVRAWR